MLAIATLTTLQHLAISVDGRESNVRQLSVLASLTLHLEPAYDIRRLRKRREMPLPRELGVLPALERCAVSVAGPVTGGHVGCRLLGEVCCAVVCLLFGLVRVPQNAGLMLLGRSGNPTGVIVG